MRGLVPEIARKQTGWSRQARNRIGNSKYVLSQTQYVHGMYRLEMKKIGTRSEKTVRTQHVQVRTGIRLGKYVL